MAIVDYINEITIVGCVLTFISICIEICKMGAHIIIKIKKTNQKTNKKKLILGVTGSVYV